MKKLLTIGLSVFMLAGCANMANDPAVQAKLAKIRETVPTCNSDKECDVKWSAARQWILANAGWKLQHVQPDYMETYNAINSSPALAVRVVKEARQEGGSRIIATVWCDNIFGCNPDKFDALMDFNSKVNASWK